MDCVINNKKQPPEERPLCTPYRYTYTPSNQEEREKGPRCLRRFFHAWSLVYYEELMRSLSDWFLVIPGAISPPAALRTLLPMCRKLGTRAESLATLLTFTAFYLLRTVTALDTQFPTLAGGVGSLWCGHTDAQESYCFSVLSHTLYIHHTLLPVQFLWAAERDSANLSPLHFLIRSKL